MHMNIFPCEWLVQENISVPVVSENFKLAPVMVYIE